MKPMSLNDLVRKLADLRQALLDQEFGKPLTEKGIDTNLWIDDRGVLKSFSFEGREIDGVLQGVIVPEPTDYQKAQEAAAQFLRELDEKKTPPAEILAAFKERMAGRGGWCENPAFQAVLEAEAAGRRVAADPDCPNCAKLAREVVRLIDATKAAEDPEGWIRIEEMPADADGDFELAFPGPDGPRFIRQYFAPYMTARPFSLARHQPTHYRPAPKGPAEWSKNVNAAKSSGDNI